MKFSLLIVACLLAAVGCVEAVDIPTSNSVSSVRVSPADCSESHESYVSGFEIHPDDVETLEAFLKARQPLRETEKWPSYIVLNYTLQSGAKMSVWVHVTSLSARERDKVFYQPTSSGWKGQWYECGSFAQFRAHLFAFESHAENVDPLKQRVIKTFRDLGGAYTTETIRGGRPRRSLILASTNASDDNLSALASVSTLDVLDLSSTTITDRGLNAVKHLKRLSVLKLDRTAVTDSGLLQLADCRTISHLSLRDTNITDDSLVVLEKLDSLLELDLSGTSITLGAIHRLSMSRPMIKVLKNK